MKTTTLQALSILALGAAITSSGCFGKKSNRRAAPPPPTTHAQAGFELPWAIGPVPEGPEAATTAYSAAAVPNPFGPAGAQPAPSAPADDGRCADDTASVGDCRATLEAAAKAGRGERALAAYERLCAKKEKLQGCGAFKSRAVGDGDRPTMALLAMCEAEQWEHCEDVSTKVAALLAWRATLKTQGCKAGATALCSNYKECKGKTRWGCQAASDGSGEVCGCVPRCDASVVAKAGARTWPDGSKRGIFDCTPSP